MILKDVLNMLGSATVVLVDTDEIEDLAKPEMADTIARGFSESSKYLNNEVTYIYPDVRDEGTYDWRIYPLSKVIVVEIKIGG